MKICIEKIQDSHQSSSLNVSCYVPSPLDYVALLVFLIETFSPLNCAEWTENFCNIKWEMGREKVSRNFPSPAHNFVLFQLFRALL